MLWTYPVKCAPASDRGYVLPFDVVILIPPICNSFSLSSVSYFDIFFIGTNESDFTHPADSSLFIVSVVTPSNSAI